MIYQVRIEYGATTGTVKIVDDDEISVSIMFPYGNAMGIIFNKQLCYGLTPVRVVEKLISHPELPEDLKNRIKVIYTAFKMEEKCTNIME